MQRSKRRWQAFSIASLMLASGLTFAAAPSVATDCAKRYIAAGDGLVYGTHVTNSDDSDSTSSSDREEKRYSRQLMSDTDKLTQSPGPWCEYNISADPTDTDIFVTGSTSQQSQAWNMRPHLITLTLGRQNASIVNQIDKCFKNVKDHDFIEANVCALAIMADTNAWTKLRNNLSSILQQFKTQMSGNPNLVVAVTGYYNPYPSATSVATKIPEFCAKLQDTIPTCIARWILLPPALVTLDQVVKKLNDTIKPVVAQFIQSSQGRFFFVNPYDKFKDHCMKMEVEIKTKVYHPTNTVHDHDSKKDFGCDEEWIAPDGSVGRKSPFLYLTPAVTGVLISATQTTKGMGYNPNEKGHDCISDLIWETVKNKLGVPQKPDLANACSDN